MDAIPNEARRQTLLSWKTHLVERAGDNSLLNEIFPDYQSRSQSAIVSYDQSYHAKNNERLSKQDAAFMEVYTTTIRHIDRVLEEADGDVQSWLKDCSDLPSFIEVFTRQVRSAVRTVDNTLYGAEGVLDPMATELSLIFEGTRVASLSSGMPGRVTLVLSSGETHMLALPDPRVACFVDGAKIPVLKLCRANLVTYPRKYWVLQIPNQELYIDESFAVYQLLRTGLFEDAPMAQAAPADDDTAHTDPLIDAMFAVAALNGYPWRHVLLTMQHRIDVVWENGTWIYSAEYGLSRWDLSSHDLLKAHAPHMDRFYRIEATKALVLYDDWIQKSARDAGVTSLRLADFYPPGDVSGVRVPIGDDALRTMLRDNIVSKTWDSMLHALCLGVLAAAYRDLTIDRERGLVAYVLCHAGSPATNATDLQALHALPWRDLQPVLAKRLDAKARRAKPLFMSPARAAAQLLRDLSVPWDGDARLRMLEPDRLPELRKMATTFRNRVISLMAYRPELLECIGRGGRT